MCAMHRHVGLPFNNQQFDVVWPLLLAMYSEHGDAMAKQYAGSAAMHKATARQTEGTYVGGWVGGCGCNVCVPSGWRSNHA